MNIIRHILFVSALLFSLHAHAESAQWQSVKTVEGAETINLEQAKTLFAKGVKFIDVRSIRQYTKRHIKGAVHLFIKDEFTQSNLLKHVQKDQSFIVYCNGAHCSLSSKAARKAVSWGYSQVKYYRGGMREWRLDGNPIEFGASK